MGAEAGTPMKLRQSRRGKIPKVFAGQKDFCNPRSSVMQADWLFMIASFASPLNGGVKERLAAWQDSMTVTRAKDSIERG